MNRKPTLRLTNSYETKNSTKSKLRNKNLFKQKKKKKSLTQDKGDADSLNTQGNDAQVQGNTGKSGLYSMNYSCKFKFLILQQL